MERRAAAVVWRIGGAVLGDAAVGVALAAAAATVAAAAIAAVAAAVRAVARVALPNKATARRATLSEACSKAMPSRAANSPAAGSEAAWVMATTSTSTARINTLTIPVLRPEPSRIPITRLGVRAISSREIQTRSVREAGGQLRVEFGSSRSNKGRTSVRRFAARRFPQPRRPSGGNHRPRCGSFRATSRRVSGERFLTEAQAAFFLRCARPAGRLSIALARRLSAGGGGTKMFLPSAEGLSLPSTSGPWRQVPPTSPHPKGFSSHELDPQSTARFFQDDSGTRRRLLGGRSGEHRRCRTCGSSRRGAIGESPIRMHRRGRNGRQRFERRRTLGPGRGDLRRRRRQIAESRGAISRMRRNSTTFAICSTRCQGRSTRSR